MAHLVIYRQALLSQEVRRQKDPGCLLCQPARRDGPGRAERQTGGRGEGHYSARPRLFMAAFRPTTEGERNTRVGGLALAKESKARSHTDDRR